ncbi:molybdopterin molybdotransferase MoeA (plasmid) [Mesorhizobium sp. B2-1-8]|uniref:molybdopterin molybdotransferase MoeA n=1 Tax=Mesorhizobium sp. B2-1-8 TaxID=2589967 RepID=UPI0011279A04|nr:gephyrin-like molybdotransferase Glp [Mesorhizobium sp. B2-1-8]UCI22910.1 molybdopterin molybdotransferase MoeA [Mesorhizobium sp. B2-1-8]
MMGAPRNNCFRSGAQIMSFEVARGVSAALAEPLNRQEDVPLAHAVGRILAATIKAPGALPPFDQAAMDGYAFRLSGKKGVPLVLPISGRTCAGDKPDVLAPGTAHRVMTGAALPGGADTVAMQEHATRRGDIVQFGLDVEAGTHIRRVGEDVKQGTTILRPGRVIGWAEVALLSALGIATVSVARPLRIVVLATGSELRDAGESLSPGAIYDSNGPMLGALLASPNAHVTSLSVRDDLAAIAQALESTAGAADVVIATAGMSIGEEDHVRNAVLRAGGGLDIVNVAMKPGKPLALGTLAGAYFIGLPGNPQAAAFGALAFARPMMKALLGQVPANRITAEIEFKHARKPDRTELLPVRLNVEQGRLTAYRCGSEGSHRLMPMVFADAVAIVPGASTPVEVGTPLEVLPFDQCRFGERQNSI